MQMLGGRSAGMGGGGGGGMGGSGGGSGPGPGGSGGGRGGGGGDPYAEYSHSEGPSGGPRDDFDDDIPF
jgi:single-strand DNA-binding protein